MKSFVALIRSGTTFFLLVIFTLTIVTPVSSQTTVEKVVVTSINADNVFPEVTVQVKPVDVNGVFIPGLVATQFSIREDGEAVQIQEVRTEPLPLNKRVVFVIDEFKIAPHVEVIREAIQSFAENQMQAGDQVEVLAASDGRGTQTIVPLTEDPKEVVNGIQEANYNPGSADGTLLLDTVKQGLADLSVLNENTEGLNTTVVFSVFINDQLDLDETIQNAADLSILIHTVLLGSEDVNGALGRLARETKAGEGTVAPENLNDLFESIDAESVQDQYFVSYRSRVDEPGEHDLVITASGVSSNAVAFRLEQLEIPLVRITAPDSDSLITRTETFSGQDPETIQPTEQTVAVEINWPDGHPREIEKTTFVVNGKSLDAATKIRDNGKDPVILEITWDLRQEDTPGETPISLVVEAEDELGLKGVSEPLLVTLNYVLFTGAETCPALLLQYAPALCSNYNLIFPLGSLVIALSALLVMVVYMRRNPKVQARVKERLGTMMTNMRGTRTNGSSMGTRLVEPPEASKAALEVVEGKSGTDRSIFPLNGTVTLGRSSTHAELVFQSDQGDRSPISRLHCTILEKGDFFDLRDEGSSNGTFLNGVRLKAGELHRLSDGDIVELARIQDSGVKLKFQAVRRPTHMGTRLVEPKAADSDNLPKDGYTPTKSM